MQATTTTEPPRQLGAVEHTDVEHCTRCNRALPDHAARERRFGGWQVLCLDCAFDDLPATD
jgi:hypothetical protein